VTRTDHGALASKALQKRWRSGQVRRVFVVVLMGVALGSSLTALIVVERRLREVSEAVERSVQVEAALQRALYLMSGAFEGVRRGTPVEAAGPVQRLQDARIELPLLLQSVERLRADAPYLPDVRQRSEGLLAALLALEAEGAQSGARAARLTGYEEQLAALRSELLAGMAFENVETLQQLTEAERLRQIGFTLVVWGLMMTAGIAAGLLWSQRQAAAANRALVQSEERFRVLAEATREGVILHDQGKIFAANTAFARMFGFAPSELNGMELRRLVARSDWQAVRAGLAARTAAPLEFTAVRHDGTRFAVEFETRQAPLRDADVGVMLVRDVTARKAEQVRLAERQAALQRLAEFRQGLVELVNEVFDSQAGVLPYQSLLDKAVQLIPGAQAGSLLLKEASGHFRFVAAVNFDLEALRKVYFTAREVEKARGSRGYQIQPQALMVGRSLDEGRGQVLVTAGRIDEIRSSLSIPITLHGEIVGFINLDNFERADAFGEVAVALAESYAAQVGVVLSRLELERELRFQQALTAAANRELEDANRRKSEFLTSMAHELRTPLSAIVGFNELLRDEWGERASDKQRRYSKGICEASEYMAALLSDLLDFAKLEAGRLELVEEVLEPRHVVASVLDVLGERIQQAGLKLVTDLAEVPPVYADGRKLMQILYNLVANALKFTPPGGEVRVRLARQGEALLFEVSDTGVGIRDTELPKLFQPFSQLGASKQQRQQGSGLGLALSKQLVELHGGTIWVSSTVGEGSSFAFSIPFRPVEQDLAQVKP
jgi:PAS domain S-box-containing protein